MKLEISLFKFDHNSDYLPYYTKHFLKIKDEKNLLDVLNKINEDAKLGYENNENFDLVINGVYVKASITLDEIVKNFGKDITIDPISIRRAYADLLINDNDFTSKLEILGDLVTDELKEEYLQLKQYYYASNTLNFKSEYVGDALLIIASKLLETLKGEQKAKLLEIIDGCEVGADYYTSLENRIYNFDSSIENRIHQVQKELGLREELSSQNFRVNKTLILDFGKFEEEYEVKHNFEKFNVAYYSSANNEKYNELVNKLDAKVLNLDTLKLDLAKNTFNKNPEITYFAAYNILLDAFDQNADFLLVDNEDDFYIFDYNRKELERLCGREVLIPVIHVNELQLLASGNHSKAKETLEKHSVNPEII